MKATSITQLVLLVLFVTSCNKKDLFPISPAPHVPSPTAPNLTLTSDTARWDSTGTISIKSDATTLRDDAGNLIPGTTVTLQHLTSPKTVTIVGVNYNSNGDSAVTKKTITVPVFSKNSTKMERYGLMSMVVNKYCVAGTENSPSAVWTNGAMSCDQQQYFANKTALIVYGPCEGSLAGVVKTGIWAWADSTETSINIGADAHTVHIVSVIFYDDGYATTEVNNGAYYYTRYKSVNH